MVNCPGFPFIQWVNCQVLNCVVTNCATPTKHLGTGQVKKKTRKQDLNKYLRMKRKKGSLDAN